MPDAREREPKLKTKNVVPKERGKSGSVVRQRPDRLLTEKFRKELAQRPEQDGEERPAEYADEQVERQTGAAFHRVGAAADTAVRRGASKAVETIKERKQSAGETGSAAEPKTKPAEPGASDLTDRVRTAASSHADSAGSRPQPPSPGEQMKRAAIKEKRKQAVRGGNAAPTVERPGMTDAVPSGEIGAPTPAPSGRSLVSSVSGVDTAPAGAAAPHLGMIREKAAPGIAIKEKPLGGVSAPKTRQAAAMLRERSTAKAAASAPVRSATKAAAGKAAKDSAKAQGQRLLVERTKKAAQAAAQITKKVGHAVVRAVAALFSALAGLVGGAVLVVSLCIVILVAAVVSSPFGILFADEQKAPGTISPTAAIAQINVEYNERLEAMQSGGYDGVVLHGQPPDWRQVIAVFACKTAGVDDGVDVATLDADRVERLRAVFWDMTTLRSEVETIEHEDWTEYILHIYIEAKTADDMRTVYAFSKYQNEALDELLAELDALGGLLGDLNITQEDAVKLLENLPEDLSPERKAVIQNALTLVGKVNYFWGGKSLTLGWDSRWGTTMQVTAAGSGSTGTYRPYGMDCSGFVDWVFYNASGGAYIIGHGGGASMQHSYCSTITWSDAKPGDLVFYPDDTHVGIVGGRDESGNLLIIHCASGTNNVVITGASGFASIGRPTYFSS